MPKGTGLGGCDPGFTPSQCSLYKLGIRAIELEETCMEVGATWEKDVEVANKNGQATEKQCEAINQKHKLGVDNKCCLDSWSQGCAFTMVSGPGDANNTVCRQYKPAFRSAE